MDKRIRVYYKARFDYLSHNMRIEMIRCNVESVKFHSHYDGWWIISCLPSDKGAIEYELKKAKTRDGYCDWSQV